MHFVMTQEDIDCGVRGDPSGCPIYQTITNQEPSLGVLVYSNTIYIIESGEVAIYSTPANVDAFIDAFDDGLNPAPIEFDLPI